MVRITLGLVGAGAVCVMAPQPPPAAPTSSNMNGPYTIANVAGEFKRLTNLSHYDSSGTPVEYFDVYSPPIRSRYGQTFWTMMDAVPLPAEIRERFDGKVMAITGYESDQVFPGEGDTPDVSVPITWAYNHHFEHHLTGKHGELENVPAIEAGHLSGHPMPDGSVWRGVAKEDDPNPDSPIPTATIFSEGNGGEFRKSFHGYAAPYAQLIESPVSWSMMPMQIDTKNRDKGKMDKPGDPFVPGMYPTTAHNGQGVPAPRTGPDATYSGLLECPCTDRITRTVDHTKPFGDTAGQLIHYEHGPETGNGTGIVNNQTTTFYKNCGILGALGKMQGELLTQKNPTCDARAYAGGLSCCTHQWFLLDKEQESPPEVMEYRIKARFYFQEHDPSRHENIWRWGFATDAGSGEYDVPKCPAGTPPENCIHEITSHLQVKDFSAGTSDPGAGGAKCNLRNMWNGLNAHCIGGNRTSIGFKPVYVGAHCHAPTCISQELYNADTGELICRQEAAYGTMTSGATGALRFDEKGYLALPPCVWGSAEDGLEAPPLLTWDTNLTSIKRANSTYAHTGEMALWQGRGVLV